MQPTIVHDIVELLSAHDAAVYLCRYAYISFAGIIVFLLIYYDMRTIHSYFFILLISSLLGKMFTRRYRRY